MFRFTIRELLILTVTAGLAVGWWVDRSLLRVATAWALEQSQTWESRSNRADADIEEINKQLLEHGLGLVWFCSESGASVGVTRLNSPEEKYPVADLEIRFDQSAFASGSPQQ